MIECICINDENRPSQIPISKWVKKDSKYTIIKITIHHLQDDIQGCELAEISLDESCVPYEYFKLDRFAISQDDLPKLKELIKLSSELSDVDIDSLIEDSNIKIN